MLSICQNDPKNSTPESQIDNGTGPRRKLSERNELIILAKILTLERQNFMEPSDMKHSTLNKSLLLTKVELNLLFLVLLCVQFRISFGINLAE